MLTITGGKLTTFRLMAVTTLRYLKKKCSIDFEFDADRPILDTPDPMTLADSGIENPVRVRLLGRFGREASTFIEVSRSEELDSIELTPTLWAEIRWAARNEGVIHLDDLLFRRTRLGLTLPEGGLPWMEEIKAIAQPELGWDDVRWGQEFQDYLDRYASNYSARL
jgi:glycerol-3-phosphate dehydrogenase